MLSIYTVTVSCIWEQEKHHMDLITGLSPSALAFVQCTKGRFLWDEAAEQKPPATMALLFLLTLARAAFAGPILELLAFASKRWHQQPPMGSRGICPCLLPDFLNQILIGCSHLVHHSQTGSCRSAKKGNISCFGDAFLCFWNKDWSACVKACRQEKLYW